MNTQTPRAQWIEQTGRIVAKAREMVDARFPEWSPTETMSGYAMAVAREAVQQAIAAERERCAKVADEFEHEQNGRAYDKRQAGRDDSFNCAQAAAGGRIATAIRSLKETDNGAG